MFFFIIIILTTENVNAGDAVSVVRGEKKQRTPPLSLQISFYSNWAVAKKKKSALRNSTNWILIKAIMRRRECQSLPVSAGRWVLLRPIHI